MSALSGKRLRRRLDDSDLAKRLVVQPILDREEQVRVDQASIDVRLGFAFGLIAPSFYGAVDELDFVESQHKETRSRATLENLYRKHYVPLGGNLVLHPHQFVLAQTLEYLRLPSDLMAYVVGRSTWGRLGLTVATAIGIHPSYAGALTLELRNLGETPLTLRPGQAIAQLFFHTVEDPVLVGPTGQYSGSVDILPKRMSSRETRNKLKALGNSAV